MASEVGPRSGHWLRTASTVLAAGLLVWSELSCSSPPRRAQERGPQPTPTVERGSEHADVRALRYRAFVYPDDAMAAAHGAIGWIEELYLPDSGVVCNILPAPGLKLDAGGKATDQWEERWRMNAFYGEIRNTSGRFGAPPPRARPVEEIRIPAETARAIINLANLNRRRSEEVLRLGEAMGKLGVLREVKSDEDP
jgi:hypothetical protein